MKRMATVLAALGTAVIFQAATQAVSAAVVKITPLGGVDGKFCILDRAMVFEDPDGTRLLYDPGFTVAGRKIPDWAKLTRS